MEINSSWKLSSKFSLFISIVLLLLFYYYYYLFFIIYCSYFYRLSIYISGFLIRIIECEDCTYVLMKRKSYLLVIEISEIQYFYSVRSRWCILKFYEGYTSSRIYPSGACIVGLGLYCNNNRCTIACRE